VENYFNYFTEIEEHFQRRRGGGLLLSTLDWALIETWKDAGIPLEAVLRGIDNTFDHYDQRPSKTRKINGLGFCSQEVLAAAEDMKEAAVGVAETQKEKPAGFQTAEIITYLRRNAKQLESAKLPQTGGISSGALARESAATLHQLATDLESKNTLPRLEDLERASSILPFELRRVLHLPPALRHCFVLRFLVGLSREACARLLRLEIRQVDERARTAMLELPTIREEKRSPRAQRCARVA